MALSQQGGVKNSSRLKKTRLYLYPDVATKTLFLITLGDEKSQPGDVLFARDFVIQLQAAREEEADDDNEAE